MFFSQATSTNASRSSFYDMSIVNKYDISFSLFSSGERPWHPPHISNTYPSSNSDISAQECLITTLPSYYQSVFHIELALSVLFQIANSLDDCTDSSNSHKALRLELEPLYLVLDLSKHAVQEYEDKPLGQSLARTITPEVKRCYFLLQALLTRINSTHDGLIFTSISRLWRQVWRRRWEGDELVSLKRDLSNIRNSLGGFLVALKSVAWIELGNELRTGFVPIRKFHASLERHLPLLGHIQLDAVQVLDHLGRFVLVPTLFCLNWEDFDYIINGHCKDQAGSRFIERGEYEVICDAGTISRAEFPRAVKPGMVLEMSIILRRRTLLQDIKGKCPGCGYFNLNTSDGWIRCRGCPQQFQIATVNDLQETHEKDIFCSEELNLSQSRSERTTSKRNVDNGNQQPRDDDSLRNFRRIRVLCMSYRTKAPHSYNNNHNQIPLMSRTTRRRIPDPHIQSRLERTTSKRNVDNGNQQSRDDDSLRNFRRIRGLCMSYRTKAPHSYNNSHNQVPLMSRTTPRRIPDTADPHIQSSEPDFAHLCSNYLTMMSQEPEAHIGEGPMTTSSHGFIGPVFTHALQGDAVKALVDVLQDDPHTPLADTDSPLSSCTSANLRSCNNNNNNNKDIERPIVNATSSFTTNQNVLNHGSPDSSNFDSLSRSQNATIDNQVNRFRLSNQVFLSTTDLAAHYGIPTFLPPIQRTTPRQISDTGSSHIQSSEPEFANLCTNHLTMLSQKPGRATMTEDSVISSVHDSTAPVFLPAASQDDAVQALVKALRAAPEMPDQPDFSEYLTSPFDDSPFDDDLLTTPALSTLDMGADILTSPIMDGWGDAYGDQPLFNDYGPGLFPITKPPTPPVTVIPSIDLHGMWSFSPQTPTLDQSDLNSPQPRPTKPLPRRWNISVSSAHSNAIPDIGVPKQHRKSGALSSAFRDECVQDEAFGNQEEHFEQDEPDEDQIGEDQLEKDQLDENEPDEDQMEEDQLEEDELDEDQMEEDQLGEDELDEDQMEEDQLEEDLR